MVTRRVTYQLDVDENQARREAQKIKRIFEQELQTVNTGTTARGRATGIGAMGAAGIGRLGGFVAGGVAGYLSVQGVQMLGRQIQMVDELGAAYGRTQRGAVQMVGSQERLNELLEAYTSMTGGAITDLEAMQSIMEMSALGFADTTAEFERFMRAVQGSAGATGRNAGYIQQQLILTLANQSTMRLDQLGLSIEEVTTAQKELMESTEGLSKEQAFQEAVLTRLNEKYGDMVTIAAESVTELQKMQVAIANFQAELAGEAGGGPINLAAGNIRWASGQRDWGAFQQRVQISRNVNSPLPQEALWAEIREQYLAYEDAVSRGAPRVQEYQDAFVLMGTAISDGTMTVEDGRVALGYFEAAIQQLGESLLTFTSDADEAARALDGMYDPMRGLLARAPNFDATGIQSGLDPNTPMGYRNLFTAQQRMLEERADEEERMTRLRIRNAERVEQAWKDAADQVMRQWEDAIRQVPGLFGASPITQGQLDLAELGVDQNFADDYPRRLTDEVVSGIDWEGVDIADAARRAGIDASLPAEAILAMFTRAWEDSSLFADPANLDLINMDAVNEGIRRSAQAQEGEENLRALFGLGSEDSEERLRDLGFEIYTPVETGMLAAIDDNGQVVGESLFASVYRSFTTEAEQADWVTSLLVPIKDDIVAAVVSELGDNT